MINKVSELTPKERAFCRYRARGSNATQAYRLAWNRPRLNSNSASSRAAEVGRRPRVIAHLNALFHEATKSELLSHGEYLDRVKRDWEHAREVGNLTAAASFARLAGQAIGSLTDTIDVRQTVDNSVLIGKLEGILDETALQALRDQFNARDTFH
jgi:hypothetical protein